MFKKLLLITLLFFTIAVYAQQGRGVVSNQNPAQPAGEDRGIVNSPTLSVAEYEQVCVVKEKYIVQLAQKYQLATEIVKQQLYSEMHKLLHEVLELRIEQKEVEISVLDSELRKMQSNAAYKDRQSEIIGLQEALLDVKNNLINRKRHKNEIVEKRLKALTVETASK